MLYVYGIRVDYCSVVMFRNLFHILREYKAASIFNLLGLCLAFFFFTVVLFHYNYELDYDSNVPGTVYQLENMRDDGVWDVNFSRPMAETILSNSSLVEEYGLCQQLAYNESAKIGFAANNDSETIIISVEQATKEYFELFDFDFVYGSISELNNPSSLIIPRSTAELLFGDEDPCGKPLFVPEFRGIPAGLLPISSSDKAVVNGVFKDFPQNTRLTNSVYLTISETEQMDNWRTCNFSCYAKFLSESDAEEFVSASNEKYAQLFNNHAVKQIRVRPVSELYFGEQARNDASPKGNRTLIEVLLFIAILIIAIALFNFINFSVALAPSRAKSITLRKVLGSSESVLRRDMIFESVVISLCAFIFAIILLISLRDNLSILLGHSIDIERYWVSIIWALGAALLGGFISGIYPSVFTTSFPASKALNGTFMLDNGAKFLRKSLIALQFVISISLVSLSLFVVLQNRYITRHSLGFNKENVLEVKLSMSTALTQADVFRSELLKNAAIKDVAFCQTPIVYDGTRPLIGYNYNDHHSYIGWTGVDYQLPEMFDIQLIEGRYFRENETAPVCIINETAAKELYAYSSELLNTYILDNGEPVEIIGIMRDVNYESLYKKVSAFAFWNAAKGTYRSMAPGNYAYVKVAAMSDPIEAINYIKEVSDKLNPGYPADVHFLDRALDNLYSKSHIQGILVALLSLIAVVISLIGVFGMAIFEAKRLKKEIAIRKVWGAELGEIMALFTKPIVIIVLISAVISIPLAFYGISIWLGGFAYHIPIYWWVFGLAVCLVLIVTTACVSYQNFKVANSNPKENL